MWFPSSKIVVAVTMHIKMEMPVTIRIIKLQPIMVFKVIFNSEVL
jgi:hypothetical protein